MADQFLQKQLFSGTTSAAGSITVATAGNALVAFLYNGASGTTPTTHTVSSSVGGSFTGGTSTGDTTNNVWGQVFWLENCAAGSHTITGTLDSGASVVLMVVEVQASGAGSVTGNNGQTQAGPGTGSNAITTGSVTVTGACTLVGMATDSSDATASNAPNVGTGFTSRDTAGNPNIGAYRLETSAVAASGAATWTAVQGSHSYVSLAASVKNATATVAQGYVKQPGPGVSGNNRRGQFTAAPRAVVRDGSVTLALTGQSITTQQGTVVAFAQGMGAIWPRGPGVGPFANVQFTPVLRGFTVATPDVTLSLSGQQITSAQGTLTPATSVALTGLAIASAQGTLTPALSLALTGQAIASQQGTITPALDLALSGQQIATSAGTIVPTITIALTGQQATLGQGTITVPGDVTVALSGLQMAAVDGVLVASVTTVATDQPSGGVRYWYDREMARRRRERKRRRELEEEAERIEDETTREIAQLLREQEARDDRRAELQRLSQLVDAYAVRGDEAALGERVEKALQKALDKRTIWALQALDRELQRANEEEQFLAMALRIILDHD